MVAKKEEELPDPWVDPTEVVIDRDRLTITLKAGAGYDAPWLVYHASTVEEGIDFLTHDRYDELADLTARKGKELAKAFGGPVTASAPKASSSGGGGWSKSKASSGGGSTDQPSGTCPTHNCDLVFADEFTKRDGSKVSARVGCPVPKCYAKTFWRNDDGTWTEK